MSVEPLRESADERRAWPRYAFGSLQEIAEVVDGKMPHRNAFEVVHCVDLSRTGLAFYRTTPPQHDSLVVALGNSPDPTYLAARIVRTSQRTRQGQVSFLVGCQFTGRVQLRDDTFVSRQQENLEEAFFLMAGANEPS